LGLIYACSVWDLEAADDIISLDPEWIKVPSARNNHFPILSRLVRFYGGDIHASLGMTPVHEAQDLLTWFLQASASQRLVFYACTSGYPVPFNEIRLEELTRIERWAGHAIKAVGFSGHHLGIAPDMAAVALGAQYIERHFTLDRTWRGTDHAASLEPDGMRRLIRDVGHVYESLGTKDGRILPSEQANRDKLRRTS
jgi:N-acetylneuraminate synthase